VQACKDSQSDPDFCIVARVEAFIAGWGLDEALKRAEAYRNAGMILSFVENVIYKFEFE
jgi:phosphoenolpyruvate phosphomutase